VRIRRVFLDAGNTLIGLEYAHLVGALAAAGFATTEEALRAAEVPARATLDHALVSRWQRGDVPRTGWVEAQLWTRYWSDVLRGAGADPERHEALTEAALSITRPAASWTRREPDLVRTLESLRGRGVGLGIISNSSGTLATHMEALDLARHFSVIIDSHHAGVEKPHPDIFAMALEAAGGVLPGEALYVGDVYGIDVLGATGAGLGAMLYDPAARWDPSLIPDGAPPCRTLRRLADLPDLLDQSPQEP
jgi:HAD superfamily hydrolase (TIGR01549 family)